MFVKTELSTEYLETVRIVYDVLLTRFCQALNIMLNVSLDWKFSVTIYINCRQ
jgi:hypothetical protein